MDIADKILEEVHFWRFKSIVLPLLDPAITYSWSNPIPVYSGDEIVGHSSLYVHNGELHAENVVNYGTPERLEAETGSKIWTLPAVDVFPVTMHSRNASTIIRIRRIELRKDCTDPQHGPIGTAII